MSPRLIKILYRPLAGRAARAVLSGRNRDPEAPEKGRFSREEIDRILKESWHCYDELAPSVPQEKTYGSQMNVLLACMSLAFFRTLISKGIERNYAILLMGDITWKIYEKWARVPFFLARIGKRSPGERMRFSVNLFLTFPFSEPGYSYRRIQSGDGISLDMLRCPVAEYFRIYEALDLCLGSWCNLDFALAEMWGGRLEREETLAAGCRRCDFRFRVNDNGQKMGD